MEDKNEQTASLDLQVVTVATAKNKTSECWIFDNSLKDDLDIDNNQVKHHRLVLSNLVV